jgi:hypothetical protein
VDYLTTLFGMPVGVSVTRAMGFPTVDEFTYEDGLRLLYKKLHGLVIARWVVRRSGMWALPEGALTVIHPGRRAGVTEVQRFEKSILHCFCQDARVAEIMKASGAAVLERLPESTDPVRSTHRRRGRRCRARMRRFETTWSSS